MNGRVYDPSIARFLSPDVQVPFPEHTQSYNRYSYVRNNPLSWVDPTGYGEKESQKKTSEETESNKDEKETEEQGETEEARVFVKIDGKWYEVSGGSKSKILKAVGAELGGKPNFEGELQKVSSVVIGARPTITPKPMIKQLPPRYLPKKGETAQQYLDRLKVLRAADRAKWKTESKQPLTPRGPSSKGKDTLKGVHKIQQIMRDVGDFLSDLGGVILLPSQKPQKSATSQEFETYCAELEGLCI